MPPSARYSVRRTVRAARVLRATLHVRRTLLEQGLRQRSVADAGSIARRQRAQVRPRSDEPIRLREHDPGPVVVESQAAFDGQIPVKEATRRLDFGELVRDITRSQNDHHSTIFKNQTVSVGPLPGPATTTNSRKWLTNRLAVATASAASAADVTASGPVP